MSGRPDAVVQGGWRATGSFVATALAAVVLIGLGVWSQRVDLLVLGTPAFVITGWSLARLPTGRPRVAARIDSTTPTEGTAHGLHLSAEDCDGVEQLTIRLRPDPRIRTDPPSGSAVTEGRRLRIGWEPQRWGPARVADCSVALYSAWSAYRAGPISIAGRDIAVLPTLPRISSDAAVPHPVGLIGANRSRRRGNGTEFADIRPFTPGDRLRLIHWPVSARTGELHVRTTYAEQDTHVLVMVDASIDFGASEGVDGRASSLDHGVRCAAALSAHFLHRGERVSLRVIGAQSPMTLRPASGGRQLHRIVGTLSHIRTHGAGELRRDLDRVHAAPGSLVVLASPLVSQQVVHAAAEFARRGLQVLVVDSLPRDVQVAKTEQPLTDIALRLRLLEREREIGQLRQHGIPVLRWEDVDVGAGLDLVLRQLARRPAPSGAGR